MSRETYSAADNSARCYDLALRASREARIRAGTIPPNPDKPDEVRWAKQGPVAVSELEAVDLRSEHQKRISEAMKRWWRRRKALEAVRD